MEHRVGENSSFFKRACVYMYTVHVNDSLGVNLRVGLGRVCLGLVAL
jgi:hypothetical protein